jgi:hypothetical protein
MNYAEKINMFMWKRNEILEKDYNFHGYYTKDDEKDILSWDEKMSLFVWNVIIGETMKGHWSCPFCAIYRKKNILICHRCPYGIRHGECKDNINSTFQKLKKHTNAINEMIFFQTHEKIIKEIENRTD